MFSTRRSKSTTAALIGLGLAITLAVSGCAGESSGGGAKTTLTFMSWQASPLEAQSIAQGLKGFEEANPNITVKYVTVPSSEEASKLRTQMAAGNAPDVFYLNPDYQRDLIDANQLLDLTPYFDDHWDMNDFIKSSQEKIQVSSGGSSKIYGVDACAVAPVLFYNKTLFKEAGVPYPPTEKSKQWTWDEFVGYMKKLTKVKNGRTSQYGTANFEEGMNLYTSQEMLASNGAKWFNDDFSKATGIDSAATRDTLKKIKDLRTVDGVAPNPSSIGLNTSNSPTQMLLTGKVASLFMGSYGLQELAASNIDLGAGLPPKMADGTVPMASCNVDAVYAHTQHPKEATELVSYLTSMKFATPMYKAGLWMPNRLSEYTPAKLAEWYDPKVYPAGWLDMKWLWVDSQPRWFDQMRNTDQIYDITTDEMQAYLYENESLDTVLPEMQRRINAALEQ